MAMASCFPGELRLHPCVCGTSHNSIALLRPPLPPPRTPRRTAFHLRHLPGITASSIRRSAARREQTRCIHRLVAVARSSVDQGSETEVEVESNGGGGGGGGGGGVEEEEEEEEEEATERMRRLESQIEKVEKAEGETRTRGKVRVYDPDAARLSKTGKGAQIADFLRVFGHLLERPYGGGESVARAGAVVISKVSEETKKLLGQEGVREEAVIEILKHMRLLEMDMELVAAARKDETLLKRLETAHGHCRKAFLIADAI